MIATLARFRVALGFLCGVIVLWLAHPTGRTIVLGTGVAAVGECLRIWAAGHLHKAREVTSSGPYRWFAHPLYLGSSIMGAGLAVVSGSWIVTGVIALYLSVTLTAAVRNEEAFLRHRFGDGYDRYRGGVGEGAIRHFSVAQAMANREYRAAAGLIIAVLLLVLRARRWP